MTQFRHVDQSSQVFEIGAFVVELSKIIMLGYVTFSQWLKSVLIVCPWKMNVSEFCYLNREDLRTSKHCSQHASNETIDTPAFLHQRYQAEMRHSLLLELWKWENTVFWKDSIWSWRPMRSDIVSYLREIWWVEYIMKTTLLYYPSFGSSIPFKVTYSSYSNKPLNSGRNRWNLSFARMKET